MSFWLCFLLLFQFLSFVAMVLSINHCISHSLCTSIAHLCPDKYSCTGFYKQSIGMFLKTSLLINLTKSKLLAVLPFAFSMVPYFLSPAPCTDPCLDYLELFIIVLIYPHVLSWHLIEPEIEVCAAMFGVI